MIESPADWKVVVRYADKSRMLSEGFTWVKVELRNCDGQPQTPGRIMCDSKTGGPQKRQQWRLVCQKFLSNGRKAHNITSALKTMLGCASTRLRQVNLVNAEVIPQDSTSPQQATPTKDTEISDTTSMAQKT